MLDTFTAPHVWGCLPFSLHPNSFIIFPVHWYVSGISVCHMGIFPLYWAFGGVPICWFFWGYQHMECPCAHSCTFCSSSCLTFLLWLWLLLLQLWWYLLACHQFHQWLWLPSLMGFSVTLDQCGMVQPPPLMLWGSGGVIASVPQQQPPSLMLLLAYANYAMGSPQVGFFFRVEPSTVFILYVRCLLSTFRCRVGCCIHLWGLNPLGFAPLQPFGVYPWQVYVQPGDGHWSMPGMYRVVAPSTTLGRGSLLLLSQLFPNHLIYMVGHTALEDHCRVTQSIHLPNMMGRGLSFPGLVPSDDMVDSESVMGIKPGDSGVVIGYQVDEVYPHLVCRVVFCQLPHLSWVQW